MPNMRSLRSVLLLILLAACSVQTDVVSQHINACLLVTEAEVEIAIGTAVTARKREAIPGAFIMPRRIPTIQWS